MKSLLFWNLYVYNNKHQYRGMVKPTSLLASDDNVSFCEFEKQLKNLERNRKYLFWSD